MNNSTRYYGRTAKSFAANGKTHFINQWGETFCGRDSYEMMRTGATQDRATCQVCRTAGDASMKLDGDPGGSPARR